MRYFKIILIAALLLGAKGCLAQYTPARVEISKEVVNIDGVLFYIHKVEQRQTLFSISKVYGVSTETLLKDNPQLSEGLKEGGIIYIRKGSNESSEQKEIRYTEHTVRWYESLSSIAKKYGVEESAIVELNSLKSTRIETRQILKIPEPAKQIATTDLRRDTVVIKENFNQDRESEDKQKPRSVFSRKMNESIMVSLLLPIGGESDLKGETAINFIEFYQGFLVALDDLKRDLPGIDLSIKVIDTDRQSISGILDSGELDGSNLIIGPIFREQIEQLVSYSTENRIPLVSPVDPSTEYLVSENPYFYQVSTPSQYVHSDLTKDLSRFTEVTLIFEEGNSSDMRIVNLTKERLNNRGVKFKELSYRILQGRNIMPQIAEILRKDKLNNVVVASESEAFVSDVLRNLNLLQTRSGYTITIYGTPRWRSFESVDINYYHSMRLNLSMQYITDYNSNDVKSFLSKFRSLYNSEPGPYAFQAYDVATYFIGNLLKYGTDDFNNALLNEKRELLQSGFNFIQRDGEKGSVNSAVRRVLYKPDFSVEVRGLLQ